MRSLNAKFGLALLLAGAIVTSGGRGHAHEGHDHGAPPPPVSSTIAPRAEASSADFELVLIARGGDLIIHLDDFRTNAPMSGATLEIDSPAGQLQTVGRGNGVYAATAPFLTKPGSYDLAITVSAKDTIDILAARLTIPALASTSSVTRTEPSWFTAPAFAQGLQDRIGATSFPIWLVLAVGFAAGLLASPLLWRRRGAAALVAVLLLAASVTWVGPAHADAPLAALTTRDLPQRLPDGALFVPKPTQHILALRTHFTETRVHQRTVELPGRVVPSPNASGLVQASVGGRLSPPEGGFKPLGTAVKAGDVLAYVRPPLPLADATAQQQQARELDQQISLVTRKAERLRAIQQIVSRSQLEDAELELKGLRTRRANLDRAQREPEALVAPVDGVIASANAVAGQMAEPNAVIFQIINPKVLWVEALSYAAETPDGIARALFPDGRTVDLNYLGTGLADRNQAVPVHFAIRGETGGLRAGQFVTVLAATTDARRGIALPREAILRGGNGQSLVYEHTNAERFVVHEVRVEPLDGTQVLVVAGVESGRRIVTQGAELLNQIR